MNSDLAALDPLHPLDLAGPDFVRNGDGELIDVRSLPGRPYGTDCPTFVAKWETWWDNSFGPASLPALIPIDEPAAYRELIGAKSRNMLKRADTIGIGCRQINHDDHLDDLYRINRSKPVRSGGPMRPAYLQRPPLIGRELELCELHRSTWAGAFLNGELRAYAHLVIVNQLALVNTILGEGPFMSGTGLMNQLVHYLVATCGALGTVRYLNYLTLQGPAGLVHFKTSVGFRSTPIERASR